jgi:hydrogenase maturation protease
MKTLILGLGNTILSDDAAGLLVAREVYDRIKQDKNVSLVELEYAGWRFVDFLSGYEKIVVIDTISDSTKETGDCYKIPVSDMTTARGRASSSHGLGFKEAIGLARENGTFTANDVSIYAIVAGNVAQFGEIVDEKIVKKIPDIVNLIVTAEFSYA